MVVPAVTSSTLLSHILLHGLNLFLHSDYPSTAFLAIQSNSPFINLWKAFSTEENKNDIYYELLVSGIKDMRFIESVDYSNEKFTLSSLLKEAMSNQKDGKIQNPELNFDE